MTQGSPAAGAAGLGRRRRLLLVARLPVLGALIALAPGGVTAVGESDGDELARRGILVAP